jgi:hypothetical protein
MFAWHETTRRLFCRGAFWLLGVLPACVIVVAAYGLRCDTVRYACQQVLALQLGVEVACQQVTFPHPKQVRFINVALIDPETGESLARAQSATITRDKQLTTIELVEAEVDTGQVNLLYELAGQTLRAGKSGSRLRVAADVITVSLDGKQKLVCDRLRGQWDFTAEAAQVLVEFTPISREASSPVSLRVVRNRQTVPASLGFELNTGRSALPVQLAAMLLPSVESLGPACQFQGAAWGVLSPTGWNGEARGTFNNVKLAELAAVPFGGSIAGQAKLRIEVARLAEGYLTHLQGTMIAHDGTIDGALVGRLAQRWGLETPRSHSPRELLDQAHPFSELAADFSLGERGLQLAGSCRTGSPGDLLIDRTGNTLLTTSAPRQLSLAALESVINESRAPLLGVLPYANGGESTLR